MVNFCLTPNGISEGMSTNSFTFISAELYLKNYNRFREDLNFERKLRSNVTLSKITKCPKRKPTNLIGISLDQCNGNRSHKYRSQIASFLKNPQFCNF